MVVQLIRRHNSGQSGIGPLLQLVVIRRDTVCKWRGDGQVFVAQQQGR